MLTNFFRINLPYGIAKNENDEWMAFNREYMPLGFNNLDFKEHVGSSYMDKPIYTKFNGLTDVFLTEIAFHPEKGIIRDEKGKIKTIFLYNDGSNPTNQNNKKEEEIAWDSYLKKLKKLSKLKRKE